MVMGTMVRAYEEGPQMLYGGFEKMVSGVSRFDLWPRRQIWTIMWERRRK